MERTAPSTQTPHYSDESVTLHHGDCIEVMRTLPDNSVDSIVTDPPYGLGFMGKVWDDLPPGLDFAVEALRVLKPGGHLLAFGGTRTWHRLAVAVEDAGFEIRDSIAWMYGSGFPKSTDVSKAIDRTRDDSVAIEAIRVYLETARLAAGASRRDIAEKFGVNSRLVQKWMGSTPDSQRHCPTWEQWERLTLLLSLDGSFDAEVWRLNGRKGTPGEAWERREITQVGTAPLRPGEHITFDQRSSSQRERRDIPATDAARRWQGWGTALKPAFEPIVVGRKPLIGTVAANVIAHGTGALNVDISRLEGGRFPANVILDESQALVLDAQSGTLTSGVMRAGTQRSTRRGSALGTMPAATGYETYGDSGGASRFFYVAKAPASERPVVDGVAHPTVKPITLMRYLVKLVTPPGGTVLEPFAGSGTTVEACILDGFSVIAIERFDEYLPLIKSRIERGHEVVRAEEIRQTSNLTLFEVS